MEGKDAPQLVLLFDGRAQETESVMSYLPVALYACFYLQILFSLPGLIITPVTL